jgi:hypothetical protein
MKILLIPLSLLVLSACASKPIYKSSWYKLDDPGASVSLELNQCKLKSEEAKTSWLAANPLITRNDTAMAPITNRLRERDRDKKAREIRNLTLNTCLGEKGIFAESKCIRNCR